MDKSNNLQLFLEDMANTIRDVEGSSELINPQDMADKVKSIGSGDLLLQKVYPVGSIYLSMNSANPSDIFGFGTWEQIKDTFLLAAGDTYSAGSIGGESTHTLTIQEIPSHTHAYQSVTHSSGQGRIKDDKEEDEYLTIEVKDCRATGGGSCTQ